MGNVIDCFVTKNKKGSEIETQKAQNKPNQASQQDLTVLKLKNAQDRLLAQKKALQKNADKARDEAKQFVAEKNKDRAMFSLKRQKLYETYLTDTENQYAILQKSIMEVESAIMTSNYLEVLQEANDLIKEIDTAGQLEKIQEIGQDIKERENQTKEFNKLFEEHHIEDVDDMYNQFAQEVEDEDFMKVSNKPAQKTINIKKEPEVQVQEQEEEPEEEDEDVGKQLHQLA